MNQRSAQILAHTLNVIEHSAPLGRRIRLRSTIPSHGDRELHPRIPRVIIDNVQLPLGIRIVETPLQSVEQVFVKELQFNRDGYPLTQSRTF